MSEGLGGMSQESTDGSGPLAETKEAHNVCLKREDTVSCRCYRRRGGLRTEEGAVEVVDVR